MVLGDKTQAPDTPSSHGRNAVLRAKFYIWGKSAQHMAELSEGAQVCQWPGSPTKMEHRTCVPQPSCMPGLSGAGQVLGLLLRTTNPLGIQGSTPCAGGSLCHGPLTAKAF